MQGYYIGSFLSTFLLEKLIKESVRGKRRERDFDEIFYFLYLILIDSLRGGRERERGVK